MLLLWNIRYWDDTKKELSNRGLWLETRALPPVECAVVEAIIEMKESMVDDRILRFRHRFRVQKDTDDLGQMVLSSGGSHAFFLDDYFEDGSGNPLSQQQVVALTTGEPDCVVLPSGAGEHHVNYILSNKKPLDIGSITIPEADLSLLGYFSRDIRELDESSFRREGAGTLGQGIRTAYTVEELRSVVLIFRRLYMEKEPANLRRAVKVFAEAVEEHPLGGFVKGLLSDYECFMESKAKAFAEKGFVKVSFTNKRVIDVFLNTYFAHQPDERRLAQYKVCLAELDNKEVFLSWAFLWALEAGLIRMLNVGRQIANFYSYYTASSQGTGVHMSSFDQLHPDMGKQERKQEKVERIIREKTEAVAMAIWKDRGSPHGGSVQFHQEARTLFMDMFYEDTTQGIV